MEEPLLQIIRRAIPDEIRLSQSEVLTAEEAACFLGLEKSYLYKLTSSEANILHCYSLLSTASVDQLIFEI